MKNLASAGRFLRAKLSSWESARARGPMAGAAETQGGWRKNPSNPVLGGGDVGVVFDVSVLREGANFRMWASLRDSGSIGYSESPDGIVWASPLPVLTRAAPWEPIVNRPCVIRRPDGYHMWYTGQTDTRSCIGYARSADGLHWRRAGDGPVLLPAGGWERASVMCPDVLWDENVGLYRMWYSAGQQYEPNAIGHATSPDGATWTRCADNPVLTPRRDHPWERARVTACHVVRVGGWCIMFYIGFHDLHRAQICLARSRDGIRDWQRHPANPIISPSRDGWDRSAVYKPSAVPTDDGWLLWYNGRRLSVEQIGVARLDGRDLGF